MAACNHVDVDVGSFIQSKHVDKVVPFYDPLKRLKLKTLASTSVIKKDYQSILSSYVCYFL